MEGAEIEETESSPSWKNWCRLCATENGCEVDCLGEDESFINLSDKIEKHFSVQITSFDVAPKMICKSCSKFIADIAIFIDTCDKVQKMYTELQYSDNLNTTEIDYASLRNRFGIEAIKFDNAQLQRQDNAESEVEMNEIVYQEDLLQLNSIKMEQSYDEEDERNAFEDHDDYDADPDVDLGNEHVSEDPQTDTDDDEENSIKFKRKSTSQKKNFTKTNDAKLIKNSTDNRKFRCEICFKGFKRGQHFRTHMKSVHKIIVDAAYPCTKCEKTFSNEKGLEDHAFSHLPLDMKLSIPCPLCDKKFTKNINLKSHLKQIHTDAKPFICEECGKPFKTIGALKEHKYVHIDDCPFKCSHCDKGFKNKARLKTHEDTHNDTIYVCTICGLQLNTRRTLKMHMLVHSDQKRHKCSYCGNEFKRAKALKNHLILHTGLKPYTCNFCDKTFANGSNCRSHKKKTHPEELAALEAAGQTTCVQNMPKLEHLRAVAAIKSPQVVEQIPSSSHDQAATQMETISVSSTPVHMNDERRETFDHAIFDSLPIGS